MDSTMKKYMSTDNQNECVNMNVMSAFGLSWSMATAGLADIQSCSWGHTEKEPQVATGWQSPPDPTRKQTAVKEQIVVPALALQLVWGFSRREWPPAEQGTCLQISQIRKGQAK